MEKLIEDIDRLLAMRRAAKDEDDKVVIDRAIMALIERHSQSTVHFPNFPSPAYKSPSWATPVMCKGQQ